MATSQLLCQHSKNTPICHLPITVWRSGNTTAGGTAHPDRSLTQLAGTFYSRRWSPENMFVPTSGSLDAWERNKWDQKRERHLHLYPQAVSRTEWDVNAEVSGAKKRPHILRDPRSSLLVLKCSMVERLSYQSAECGSVGAAAASDERWQMFSPD